MSVISRLRRQTCVVWTCGGFDDFGRPSHSAPVEISCRWVDVAQGFINARGEQVLSYAKVYVGAKYALGDVLMRGTLADVQEGVPPKEHPGAFEIRRFEEMPNLRNTETLFTAYL